MLFVRIHYTGVVSILEIGQLKKLEVLDAMSNKLRSIPSELASCSSLKRLLLDRNLLSWLPRQLSTMSSLEEISAASNKLLYLPLGWLSNCFFFVRAKRPLVVHVCNMYCTFVTDVGDMTSLRSIYVDNNPYLHAVPLSVNHQELGFSRQENCNDVLK